MPKKTPKKEQKKDEKLLKKVLTNHKPCAIISHVAEVSGRTNGSIAQLGEHLPYKQRVTGSSPVVPTKVRFAL